jgi:exopolysaccharide production protein ExoQ
LSILWSDYSPLSSRRILRSVIELTSWTLIALSMSSSTAILRSTFNVFFIVTMLDLGSIAFPKFSFTPIGFAGVHFHKNLAGLFFFLALPIFAIGVLDRSISRFRTIAIVACAASAVMLVLSQSKSAIGVLLLSTLLAGIVRICVYRNVFSRILLPMICSLGAGCLGLLIFNHGIAETLNLFFGDATLTGRAQIWQYVLYVADKNPWRGVGYGALWQVGPDVEATLKNTGATWVPNEGHNGYLDVLAQLGYAGLLLLGVYLLATAWQMLKCAPGLQRSGVPGLSDYAFYVFWGAVIYNITESSFFRPGHSLWFMLVFVSASIVGIFVKSRQKRATMMKHSGSLPRRVGRRRFGDASQGWSGVLLPPNSPLT